MSNPYKRLKIFLHSTFTHESNDTTAAAEEDVYKFQPMKMCLEYKTDVKKAIKYPNNFPMPRSGHRIVCNDQYVISYGGYNPRTPNPGNLPVENELYKEVWKFDTVHKKWRLLDVANTPPYAASNCCTLIGSNIVTVFGGTSYPFGEESGNDLYVLDLAEEEKFRVVTGEEGGHKPPGRYGQAVVIDKTHLYSIGGTTGFVYSMDIHHLNLETNQWSCLYNSDLFGPGDPEPRYRHEVALYRGRIYILGGGTEQKVFSLEDIHSFDLTTHMWSLHHTLPDPATQLYPAARKCHALSQSHSSPAHVLLLGGISTAEDRLPVRQPVLDDVWRLDLSSLQWTRLPVNLPARVYFHALASSPRDKIYIFGGITSARRSLSRDDGLEVAERTADLYSVYLSIPSLKEMSSEAVKYYYRNRVYDQAVLSSYGIQY